MRGSFGETIRPETHICHKSLQDLRSIRLWSILIAVIHCAISVGMMVMSFSRSHDGKYSETIVVSSFVACITCVWTIACAYETCLETAPIFRKNVATLDLSDLASWEWHNTKFMQGLSWGMVLTLVLFPSLMIFTIGLFDKSFWELVVISYESEDRQHFIVLMFHFIAIAIVACIFLVVVIVITRRILKLQKEESESTGEHEVIMDEEEEEPPDPAYERSVKAVLFGDVILLADLSTIVWASNSNSGTVVALIFDLLIIARTLWFWKQIKIDWAHIHIDLWLSQWRIWCFAHAFFGYMTTIFALLQLFITSEILGNESKSFWAGLSSKEGRLVIYAELSMFFFGLLAYGTWMFYHVRCMNYLDELRTIQLIPIHNEMD